jgi:hypothetical protein
MAVRQLENGADQRRSVIAVLAAAGITGPIIFAVVALCVLRPDHNFLEHPISALAAGPSGWVQDMNLLVFGVAHDLICYRASSRSARDSMGCGRSGVPRA